MSILKDLFEDLFPNKNRLKNVKVHLSEKEQSYRLLKDKICNWQKRKYGKIYRMPYHGHSVRFCNHCDYKDLESKKSFCEKSREVEIVLKQEFGHYEVIKEFNCYGYSWKTEEEFFCSL